MPPVRGAELQFPLDPFRFPPMDQWVDCLKFEPNQFDCILRQAINCIVNLAIGYADRQGAMHLANRPGATIDDERVGFNAVPFLQQP